MTPPKKPGPISLFRSTLVQRRRQLREAIGSDANSALLANQTGAEVIDLAQNSEQADRAFSLAQRERRACEEIDRALTRLGSGRYGICEECEREIPTGRLTAIPEARLCAPCQALDEREEGHGAIEASVIPPAALLQQLA